MTLQLRLIIAAIAVLGTLAGCQKGQVSQEDTTPIFYPPAPDKPRIQYLTSFSGATDVDAEDRRKVGGFEKFIVGDAVGWEQTEIAKPFGMTLYEGKIYICDVGRSAVEIIDLKTGKFSFLTRDRRLMNPGNIVIDHGNKYVSDSRAGAVFVFDKDNTLVGMWGKEAGLMPVDVDIYEDKLYVLDGESCQVVVFDKITGKELDRIGKKGKEIGELNYVTGMSVDHEGNIYVADTVNARVTKLDKEGIYKQAFGFQSTSIHGLIRPKGLDVDKEGRLWIIDAGTNVAKIYNTDGQLLLYFGLQGMLRGQMYLPASVRLDYDNIEYFQKYAVDGAELECVILVSNQFGPNKISVYGFGKFPAQEKAAEEEMLRKLKLEQGGGLLQPGKTDSDKEDKASEDESSKEGESTRQGERNEDGKEAN